MKVKSFDQIKTMCLAITVLAASNIVEANVEHHSTIEIAKNDLESTSSDTSPYTLEVDGHLVEPVFISKDQYGMEKPVAINKPDSDRIALAKQRKIAYLEKRKNNKSRPYGYCPACGMG